MKRSIILFALIHFINSICLAQVIGEGGNPDLATQETAAMTSFLKLDSVQKSRVLEVNQKFHTSIQSLSKQNNLAAGKESREQLQREKERSLELIFTKEQNRRYQQKMKEIRAQVEKRSLDLRSRKATSLKRHAQDSLTREQH